MDLEQRLLALEAETLVQRELIRALIGRTKPDPLLDASFNMAVQAVNAVARQSEPSYQQAIADALARLNPHKVARLRP